MHSGPWPSIGYRDTWAEIRLDAIAHNVREFKSRLDGRSRFMAVVKADGYGHGAVEVARTAVEAGADYLGVALLDEALELRAAGIGSPILALGYTPPRSVETAVRHGITITVFSDAVLDEVMRCADRQRKTALIHLKMDTGMTRIGLTDMEQIRTMAERAMSSPYVAVEGLFTHFAEADVPDSAYTRAQYGRFAECIDYLQERGVRIPLNHCCNSAAVIHFPDMHLDMVRVGIGMYGLSPSPAMKASMHFLKQAMHFKTRISMLRPVPEGQPVGYGCTYSPPRDSLIATVPVGYADGWSRALSGKGSVLVRGRRAPVAGRICMDQAMIDVTAVPGAAVGDEVTLFGGTPEDGETGIIPIDEIASHMNTINYEVVCLIGKRVPRIYSVR